jgi:hypothetical protein
MAGVKDAPSVDSQVHAPKNPTSSVRSEESGLSNWAPALRADVAPLQPGRCARERCPSEHAAAGGRGLQKQPAGANISRSASALHSAVVLTAAPAGPRV